jgi:NitT/TauT family transport system substrate-binding protein
MGWGCYSDEDSDIQQIRDLEGRSVVMSPASSEAITIPALFAFLDMDDDAVTRIAVEPAQKISTYARGEGDAMVTIPNFADPIVQADRPSDFLAWVDEGFQMPEYCVIAYRDTVDEEPEFVQDFLDALFQGIAEAEEDPDAAVASILDHRALLEEDATQRQLELTFPMYFSENTEGHPHGYHSPEDWQFALEILRDYADLSGPWTSMISTTPTSSSSMSDSRPYAGRSGCRCR